MFLSGSGPHSLAQQPDANEPENSLDMRTKKTMDALVAIK
jgi:hypothetical protein